MNIDECQYRKGWQIRRSGLTHPPDRPPAFIRAHLALASSYVKNAFTFRFLFALQIPLAIRSSHIKQKKNRLAAILSLAGGVAPSKSELNADSISSSEIASVPC